jgi:hypothetical protein
VALIERSEHCINPRSARTCSRGEDHERDELSGKVAIVTRGASGIGRMTVAALLGAGATPYAWPRELNWRSLAERYIANDDPRLKA